MTSHDTRADMCARLVGRLLTTPEGEERIIEGIGPRDLGHCWRYDYYLRACERCLPDDARASLA
jgi:hypothetical protein